jgi:phosphate uptake regulator
LQIRKLVKSGAASHTIALPKEWLDKNNLNKGDLLYITEKNNELVISSDTKKPKIEKKEISISVDKKEINTIRRQTISAYINNYSIFTFHGDSLNKNLEEIRKILDNFLALEIVEQTNTKLVAKDFLNLEEFSITNTIRRMDMLTRSIISDAKKGEKESQALEFRDYEVDKLLFLISRLIRSNLEEPSSKLPNTKALSVWWLAKNLESISDAAKKISRIFNKESSPIYDELEQFYLECIKSYVKDDKKLADDLIAKRIELIERLDKLKGDQKYLLKDFLNNSRNIAKIVLDN